MKYVRIIFLMKKDNLMKDILIYASCLSCIYFVLRLSTGNLSKEKLKGRVKEVFTESCIIFLSCYVCEFMSKRLGFRGVGSCVLGNKETLVFTDNAGF
jgi:hypothetical protein